MTNLNFSQRNGYSSLPSQLQLGYLPKRTRYRIANSIAEVIQRNTIDGYYLTENLEVLLKHIWIEFFEQRPSEFPTDPDECSDSYEKFCENSETNRLFDLLEILCQSPLFKSLKSLLTMLLKQHHTAYIFENGLFIPISDEHTAEAFLMALENSKKSGRVGATTHLKESAKNLRDGKWADSVRESIHAVESLIGKMDIKSNTLGAALGEIEKSGHLHPALKTGFSNLYGWTSDEDGIRHAIMDGINPKVNQADALYMLGSCSSFITYLLAQGIPERK